MKLTHVKIKRYRVFSDEVTIPLSGLTVVTGANNLGKSTVLSALDLLFSTLPRESLGSIFEDYKPSKRTRYELARDYPQHKLGRRGKRSYTSIGIEVVFSEAEVAHVSAFLGSAVPTSIWITGEFGNPKFKTTTFECSPELGALTRPFLVWFGENFRFTLIPTSRNVNDLQKYLLAELVKASFRGVRSSARRLKAIQSFYDDVRKEMDEMSATLVGELRPFLPNVEHLQLVTKQLNPIDLIGIEDVLLNDGALTSLDEKGDGVKSLFAISILQYLARSRYDKNLVFGIEEPEAHLHPTAVYELKTSLRTLSESCQILITTHSPILVQRDKLASNIVIQRDQHTDFSCTALPARNLTQIRDALGIKPQDNMLSAELVLLVEGTTEEVALSAIFANHYVGLANALATGRLRIIPAGGASKITAILRTLAREATSCIVLLDSDSEGRTAEESIARSGLINPADVFLVPNRGGCRETEFEDSFDPQLYLAAVATSCGIVLDLETFEMARSRSGGRGTRVKKWSEIMDGITASRGKSWTSLENQAKSAFAKAVAERAGEINMNVVPYIASLAGRALHLLQEG